MPICQICGSYFARKELGCPNCSNKEQEKRLIASLELDLKQRKEELERVREETNKSLSKLRDQVLNSETTVVKITDFINSIRLELMSGEKEFTDLEGTMKALTIQITNLRDTISQKTRTKTELENRIIQLDKSVAELSPEIEKKKSEFEEKRQQMLLEAERRASEATDETTKAKEVLKIESIEFEKAKMEFEFAVRAHEAAAATRKQLKSGDQVSVQIKEYESARASISD